MRRYQRITSEWHLRVAQAILRNWDMDAEIVTAIGACDDLTREHAGATDLTDVLVASAALIALGPDPRRPKKCCSSACRPRDA